MLKFPKIETIFKRDETGKISPELRKSQSILALSYMNALILEEKIDGTNAHITLTYDSHVGDVYCFHYSRNNLITDKDIMYIKGTLSHVLDYAKIKQWYKEQFVIPFVSRFDYNGKFEYPIVRIYGEVYGSKIQKNKYTPPGVRDFRGFDIKIGDSWLSVKDRNTIFAKIGIKPVPTITVIGKLPDFKHFKRALLNTDFSYSRLATEYGRDSIGEGFIIRPPIAMYTNHGRVIAKIKVRDYNTTKENRKIDRGE